MTRAGWRLGRAGIWLAVTGLIFILTGVATGAPVITLMGGLPIVALLWSLAVARSISGALRRGGLELTLGDGGAEPAEWRVHVDTELTIPISVTGPLADRLGDITLTPGPVAPLVATIETRDEQRALVLECPRAGHAWLQGFTVEAEIGGGLVMLRRWLPREIRLTALPRRFPLRGDAPLQATRAALQDRAGLGRARRRGFGLEIRELRDHQPGDPFKHIAWAATARRGKLVTREFESNLMLSVWVLVDVSPSMFWGEPGRARVDFAIETAYNLSSLLLGRGDRAGLMLHDHRVRHALRPSAGRGQLYRILDGLLEAPHLCHADRTELTHRELTARVARWLHAQHGLSFDLPPRLVGLSGPRHTPYDERALRDAVEQILEQRGRAAKRSSARRPPIPIQDYAHDREQALYRGLCRRVGIALPLDPTPRPGGQARGLEEAVHTVLRSGGGPHTLVVISDLHTVDDLEALRRAALGARRHRHALIVLCPADPAFEAMDGQARSALGDALQEVERLRAVQNVSTVEAILGPAGVTVLSCSPGDVMPRLLRRLDQVA